MFLSFSIVSCLINVIYTHSIYNKYKIANYFLILKSMNLALEKQNRIIETINKEMYFRGISKVELAKKMGLKASTNLINILNCKRKTTDNYIIKIAKAIGLSQKDIDDIFQNAEKLAYKKLFGKTNLEISDYGTNDLVELIAIKENLNKKQINKLKDFIKYLK